MITASKARAAAGKAPDARKAANVVYGVLDVPPRGITALSGLQHVGLMSVYLVYPVLLAEAAGASSETAAAMISLTLVALGAGTLLQVVPFGPVGSGFLCQPIPTVLYMVPALIAAKQGGLPLVFGMTLAAGLLQMALSQALRHLRPIFPPEIAGLVVLLAGIATGVVGLRAIFATGADASAARPDELALALFTLTVMVALNVWARGWLRMFCVLIGMAGGYCVAVMTGRLAPADVSALAASPVLDLPGLGHLGWTFDPALAVPFALAAVAATLKVAGNVTTSQKANDPAWTRPDMRSISRGALADGLANVVAAGLGSQGLNSSTAAVGIASATGVHSRRVAWAIAAILAVLALVPKLGLLLYAMPRPVAGAALVFSSTFIVVNGLQIMTSRLLDARRTLVIGLALVAGLAVDLFPALVATLPPAWRTMLGTSLVLGTLVGLGLNLLFRIGVRRTESLAVPQGPVDTAAIEEFMTACGAAWGARRDVIERASFNLAQSVETIFQSGAVAGSLAVRASFDEFRLDLRVSYDGAPLELPDKRPSNEEILASEEGERKLAGFMLRRFADRVAATHKNGRSTVHFHFDH